MTVPAPTPAGSADLTASAGDGHRLVEVAVPMPFFGTLTFDEIGRAHV